MEQHEFAAQAGAIGLGDPQREGRRHGGIDRGAPGAQHGETRGRRLRMTRDNHAFTAAHGRDGDRHRRVQGDERSQEPRDEQGFIHR
jgi:hypothetical protein